MTDLSLGEATKGPAPHIKRRPSRTMAAAQTKCPQLGQPKPVASCGIDLD